MVLRRPLLACRCIEWLNLLYLLFSFFLSPSFSFSRSLSNVDTDDVSIYFRKRMLINWSMFTFSSDWKKCIFSFQQFNLVHTVYMGLYIFLFFLSSVFPSLIGLLLLYSNILPTGNNRTFNRWIFPCVFPLLLVSPSWTHRRRWRCLCPGLLPGLLVQQCSAAAPLALEPPA